MITTKDTLIEIVEKFNRWLDSISVEYKIDKDILQELIKYFLM